MWQVGATLHRGARASHHHGLSCCGARAPDAQAQQLWRTGSATPWHVGSSQTRARTRVPCIGRQILNHCATREAPPIFSLLIFCLEDLSIAENGVLNFLTTVVLLPISVFRSVSICLIYLGALMLGAYVFIIVIFSWLIDPFLCLL